MRKNGSDCVIPNFLDHNTVKAMYPNYKQKIINSVLTKLLINLLLEMVKVLWKASRKRLRTLTRSLQVAEMLKLQIHQNQ